MRSAPRLAAPLEHSPAEGHQHERLQNSKRGSHVLLEPHHLVPCLHQADLGSILLEDF